MKYAIDRYAIGTEKEVSADEFDNKSFIHSLKERFFCPECGERVFFRNGGYYESCFYHQKKTDRSPECDKRVDGRSNLTISQRVGLPLFITQISKGNFQLNIGFPALGIKTLENAAKCDCTVKISSYQQYRIIKVNQSNFLSDNTTLIPVNFIPLYGKNYSISIEGRTQIFELQRKWSDYADGFESNGAIFSYNETGGKKIRRGDSISTNRYYYAVVRNDFLYHTQISQTEIGKLIINKTSFKVIKFKIDVSVDNRRGFTLISSYIKSNYGVWLLECPPELIPVWPPVVQQDYMIPVKNDSNVICVVSSGNADPSVFSYSGNSVYKKDVKTVLKGVHTVELSISTYPTILSVDRKYAGREVTFITKALHRSSYSYDFLFINSAGEKKELTDLSKSEVAKGVIIESNSKFDLFFGTSEMIYKPFSIREQQTSISENKGITEICLLIGSSVYDCIKFNKEVASDTDINILSQTIMASAKGQLIPIPVWVNHILQFVSPLSAPVVSNVKQLSNQLSVFNSQIDCVEDGEIDDIDTFEDEVSENLTRAGYANEQSIEISQAISFGIFEKAPLVISENAKLISQCLAAILNGGTVSEVFIPINGISIEELSAAINDNVRKVSPMVCLIHGIFDSYSINLFNALSNIMQNWTNVIILLSLEGTPSKMIMPGVWNRAIFIDGDSGFEKKAVDSLHSFIVLDSLNLHDRTIDMKSKGYKDAKKTIKLFTKILSNMQISMYSRYLSIYNTSLNDSDLILTQLIATARSIGNPDRLKELFHENGIGSGEELLD